jgi:hypothetical protein
MIGSVGGAGDDTAFEGDREGVSDALLALELTLEVQERLSQAAG